MTDHVAAYGGDTIEHGRAPAARRPSRALVVAGLIAIVAAAGVIAIRRGDEGTPGTRVVRSPAASPVGSPTPTPAGPSAVQRYLDALPRGTPLQQLLVVDGRLVDASTGQDRTVAQVPFTRVIARNTPHGLLFQGDAAGDGDPARAWALGSPDGAIRVLRSGLVGSLSLNADQSRAAYTTHDDKGTEATEDDVVTVELVTFPELRRIATAALPPVDAWVNGFVGSRVLITVGGNQDVGVYVWSPGQLPRGARHPWRVVEATEPRSRLAVVRDDEKCGHLLEVGAAVPPYPGQLACLGIPSFSTDGTLLASYERASVTEQLGRLRLRSVPSMKVLGELDLPIAARPIPITRDVVLLLVEDPVDEQHARYAVVRCTFSTRQCEVAWRSDEVRGFRQVSVVAP